MTKPTNTEPRYAGLFRRLFAIFYDSFLLLAILFIFSAIVTVLNNGKAIEPGDALYPVFVILVFSLSYLYFTWFWINGGQSLGMKTWQIQLHNCDPVNKSDGQITWKIASIRFFSAIVSWGVFGLGFLWAFFDTKKRCWHDLISKTVLLDVRNRK